MLESGLDTTRRPGSHSGFWKDTSIDTTNIVSDEDMLLWLRRWLVVKILIAVATLGLTLLLLTKPKLQEGFGISIDLPGFYQDARPPGSQSSLTIPSPSQPSFSYSEQTHSDGVLHYQRISASSSSNPSPKPSLLWLTLTKTSESWGAQGVLPIPLTWSKNRTFSNHLALMISQVNVSGTSIGLLTSSRDEYDLYKSILERYAFPRTSIFLHHGYDTDLMLDRNNRHDPDRIVQTRRRAELARLRNYLMLNALGPEEGIVWLDADIYALDTGLVYKMVQHARSEEKKGAGGYGILTARREGKGVDDYDRNAWRGARKAPAGQEEVCREIDAPKKEQLHVAELYKDTKDDELVELTTVGATILYIRASLVWQGLSFPHQYTIGTRWEHDGWDGIESEGLCYRARGLDGGKCAFLGGKWKVKHTTDTTN